MQYRKATLLHSKSSQAFSLIELVMVMAILGIVAAMAVPRFADAAMRSRIDAAAKRIAADLELARKHAIYTSTPQKVIYSQTGYEIPGMRDLDHSTSFYKVNLSAEPYQVFIRSAMSGNDLEISFDIYGNADRSITIIIQAGRQSRRVTFDQTTGKSTVE